jgi:hypothetical protein
MNFGIDPQEHIKYGYKMTYSVSQKKDGLVVITCFAGRVRVRSGDSGVTYHSVQKP